MDRPTSVVIGPRSAEAVALIMQTHFPDARLVLDVTWGRGVFWRTFGNREQLGFWPELHGDQVQVVGMDRDPEKARDAVADCTALPVRHQAVDVGVLDLPYMHAAGSSTIKLREAYSSMGSQAEFIATTVAGAGELRRVSRQGLIIKGKNSIEAGHYRHNEAAIVNALGNPTDVLRFIPTTTLATDPKWNTVEHFRIQDSFFLIYKSREMMAWHRNT